MLYYQVLQPYLGLPEAKSPIFACSHIPLLQVTLSWQVNDVGDHMTMSPVT